MFDFLDEGSLTAPAFDPNSVSMPALSPMSSPLNFAPYLTMTGGTAQAMGTYFASRTNAALARANAGVAGLQAQSAIQAGGENAQIYRQKLQQVLGRQAAQIGGSNVTTSGSALRALETTNQIGSEDIARIQLNAARKAWGFQVNQAGDLARAKAEQDAGVFAGVGSLITTGAKAYGQWSE